jgi:hypothetical protein
MFLPVTKWGEYTMSEPQTRPNSEPNGGPSFQIVTERLAQSFEFLRRSTPPRAHIALVLLTAKGQYLAFRPDQQPTVGETFWKRIRTIYEVDIGQHQTSFEVDIPSQGDAFSFHAAVDLQWRVTDPSEVVRRHIDTTDALVDTVRPDLLNRMRMISRKYGVVESEVAETAINDELAAPLGPGLGLWTRPYVRLSLEQSTREHASEVLSLHRKTELEELTQKLRVLEEANHRELLEQRISLYRGIIAAGDIDQFAVRIAHNPGDVGAVMEAIQADRDAGRRHAIDFFTRLAESGLIERHEMSDIAQETLQWLNESVTRVIGRGTDHTPGTDRRRQRLPGQAELQPPPLPEGLHSEVRDSENRWPTDGKSDGDGR